LGFQPYEGEYCTRLGVDFRTDAQALAYKKRPELLPDAGLKNLWEKICIAVPTRPPNAGSV